MTGGSALVGLAVAVSLAAASGPRRHLPADRRMPGGHGRPLGRTAVRRDQDATRPTRPTRALAGRRGRAARDDGRLAAALVEVASLVRAGTAPADAWTRVLDAPVPDRVPTVGQLATVAGTAGRPRGSAAPPLEAVVAAARVADELGAPLAAVLDQVAAAIAAQAEAAADVEAALAGPRSSARILAWLPVLGLLLGTALGADPVGVLLGGGLGTAAGVLGAALMVVGRWWSATLLRGAGHAGDEV